MNKKEYKQPSVKVVEIEGYQILAGSSTPAAFSLFDEGVQPSEDPADEEKGWAKQW